MRFAFSVGVGRALGLPRAFLPGWMRESVLCFIGNASLDRSKEKVPGDIDGGVDQCGGKDRTGLAPCPPVEKAGDGGQDYVAPVGKAHVGDVRESEENGSGPPAGKLAIRSARKQVLEQAAEEQLFRPRGEEQNAE